MATDKGNQQKSQVKRGRIYIRKHTHAEGSSGRREMLNKPVVAAESELPYTPRPGASQLPNTPVAPSPTPDPDQAYFWTEEWQALEREAEEDLREGRYKDSRSMDDFLEELMKDE